MTVYLLHFEKPIGDWSNPRGQAQHYIGSCEDGRLNERLAEHRSGQGAAITRFCVLHGVAFNVAATWDGGRDEERALKRRKSAPRLCPICREEHGE